MLGVERERLPTMKGAIQRPGEARRIASSSGFMPAEIAA